MMTQHLSYMHMRGADYCFTSGCMAYGYSISGFETVLPLGNFLLPVKLFLNWDMVISEDYVMTMSMTLSYAVPRLKFLCCRQLLHVPVTVGSLVHEDMM